ncbi:MAG: 2-dehydro-3-deoxy-D-gluconate 5-dehydrogenase KduD [Ignavibacteriales bacterium]|nr:2-dehydro-3-deoxy-D-gluconate 5-dehydrogenase KduD [Ignavibacteriales bacterium]
MKSMFDLTGRVAIVTGGFRGLGRGMSIGLAEAGADVVLVDREEALETAGVIQSMGRKSLTVVADLMSIEAIPSIVQRTVNSFGKVDILVNSAGTIRRTPAIDYSEKDWDDIMAVNAKTVFFFSQAVARDMMKRKSGKIINIASLLSFQGGIIVPAYAASKGAVAQVTKALANEWAAHGINVNAIAPGYMATDVTKALREDPVRSKAIFDRIPASRWGTPEDLAGVAVFLASSASDYVNGHVLVVDGGWLAR